MADTSDEYFTMQGLGDPVSASGQGEKAGSQASSSNDCSSSLVGNLATGEYTITGRKLSDKTSSLQKRRQKSNKRTAELLSEELEERKKKRRLYMKNYRAKQSKEATQARLQHLRQSAAERRDTESEQAKKARLQQMRQHAAETRDSESELAKEARLQQMRQHAAETRDSESELAKQARLQQMRQHAIETRDSESEFAKEARLQQMRQHAAETRDSESELAKEARLQQYKRQIYREQVQPHSGGKIPEDAFRVDRLALNRLNKDGIAVPDGILLDARHHDKHPHPRPSDLQKSVIKVLLSPDNRYVPPEGGYYHHHPVAVDSTYIIRPPVGSYKHGFPAPATHEHQHLPPPQYPIPAPFNEPIRSEESHGGNNFFFGISDPTSGSFVFQSQQSILSDSFYHIYSPETVNEFESLFNQFSHGRLIRESSNSNTNRNSIVSSRTKPPTTLLYKDQGAKIPGSEGKDYPSYTTIPETSFRCTNIRNRNKMYPDPEARCQVFHVCQSDGRKESFLCPKGTIFNDSLNHCDWWYNVKCG